jgi:hypothetical protein
MGRAVHQESYQTLGQLMKEDVGPERILACRGDAFDEYQPSCSGST